MKKKIHELGLALSGGGYRASAFHLGTLNKLHELQILSQVDVMSTISGGSITGAAWCLSDKNYPEFHQEMIEKLRTKNVIKYVLTSWTFIKVVLFVLLFLAGAVYFLFFSNWPALSFLVIALLLFLLLKFQFILFPVSKEVEKAYNKFFYDHKKLGDLLPKHLLAIGSSNLQTGRPLTFSRLRMSDSAYANEKEFAPNFLFVHEKFPVARAVMASSCVPFAFTPVRIAKEFYPGGVIPKGVNPQLVDGGVYDNQGIQKITQPKNFYECRVIITSDAGGRFTADKKYSNVIALLIRTVDLFMVRIKNAQMVTNVYRNTEGRNSPIAYLSLGWTIEKCIPGFVDSMESKLIPGDVIAAHKFQPEWIENPSAYKEAITKHLEQTVGYETIEKRNLDKDQRKIACETGTNLTPLSAERIAYLIRHAENLTELQVKLYCPGLI